MAVDQRSDGSFIAQSLAEPAAFGAVFDRHFDSIHAYLRRQIGGDMADDLASQTFLVAFDRRTSFDLERESARPWLFGIAANLLRRHYREVRQRFAAYSRAGLDSAPDGLDGIEERVDASELRTALATALGDLRREELEVLLLHTWGELTYSEIAAALEIPMGTVRSRISRGCERVRRRLAEDGASIHSKEGIA